MRYSLKMFSYCCVLFLLLSILACGGRSSSSSSNSPAPPNTNPAPPPPTPPPPPPPPALTASKFLYGVSGFEPDGNGPDGAQINSNTGAISLISGSPFDQGLGQSNVFQLLADPKGRFLYSLHQAASAAGMPLGQSGIGEQKIDPQTGALTLAPSSPVVFSASDNNSTPLAIDGLGRFLFQDIAIGFDIYTIDQNSGTLTKSGTTGTVIPLGPNLASSPDGKFFFNAGAGSIQTLAIDQQSGQLTLVSGMPVPAGGSAGPMAIEADGKFLYVANSSEGTISVFAISSVGTLTPVTGSPFMAAAGAQFFALTPNGHFLYGIFGTNTSLLEGFQVNPAAGSFAAILGFSPIPANAIALDGSGKFVYTASQGIFTYAIDPASGALQQVSSSPRPFSDDPSDLVTVP